MCTSSQYAAYTARASNNAICFGPNRARAANAVELFKQLFVVCGQLSFRIIFQAISVGLPSILTGNQITQTTPTMGLGLYLIHSSSLFGLYLHDDVPHLSRFGRPRCSFLSTPLNLRLKLKGKRCLYVHTHQRSASIDSHPLFI